MSDISLQRYKARRAFKTLNEDKRMDNSEYIRLKSIIETVKGTSTKKTVVTAPKNRVYIFIMDDTFSTNITDSVGSGLSPSGYFTKVSRNNGIYSSGNTAQMEYYNGVSDMIKVFHENKPSDNTNHYHYIKVDISVGLNVIDTKNEYDDLASAINDALIKSLVESDTKANDTIIERIIVAHGTDDIKTVYDAAYATNTDPTYREYKTTVSGTQGYDHISNVDSIISYIKSKNNFSYMSAYSSSNTIVLYPNSNIVSSDATPIYYSRDASIFFRRRMSEQNNDKYTLLYTEWSVVNGIEYAPSGSVYDSGVNTLTEGTHERLGKILAALE